MREKMLDDMRIGSVFICLLCFSISYGQSFSEVLSGRGDTIQTNSTDYLGSGVSFYDFDQDGWDDVTFAIENDTQVVLQNNHGTLQSANIEIPNLGESKMILWVDYDNDNDLDLFLTTQHGSIKLWMNNGNFSFTDETLSAGLSTAFAANFGASFGDYDKDGDLDLYVCRYTGFGDSTNLDLVNNLYRNNGNGTFTDVSFAAGVSDGLSPSFQSVWVDYNNDSWPDLFVVNDRNTWKNGLYLNNTDGTFTSMADSAGVTMLTAFPMTGSFADFDNDNDLDLFVSSSAAFLTDLPSFFVNQNDGTFIDEAFEYNLQLNNTTFGGLWLDYDNDLDQDLYVATDWLYYSPVQARNYFMVNEYPLPFVEDSTLMLGYDTANSHAVARGDLNRDGFYDIAVHTDAPSIAQLWESSGNNNNYIRITLRGTVSNSMAIGSWIKVFVGGHQYTQYTFCGENYLGQNSQHHIFGLGSNTLVDSVHIEYLSDITDKYYNLSVNQEYLFTEGETQGMFPLTINGSNPICEGDSVSLIAPEYAHYLWNTGDTTQAIVVFEAGDYFVEVIDSVGFQNESLVLHIDTAETVDFQLAYSPISCDNSTDGEIYLEVLNEGQEYSISWSNGQFGDTASNLGAGSYTYVYLDEFTCQYEDELLLEDPSPLNVQLSLTPQTESDWGSMQWLANGGTPPYFALLDGDTISSSFIDSLESGLYDFSLIDGNNCSWTENIEILFTEDSVISGLNREIAIDMIRVHHDKSARKLFILSALDFPNEIEFKLFNILGKEIPLSSTIQVQRDKHQILIEYNRELDQGLLFLVVTLGNHTKSFPLLVD